MELEDSSIETRENILRILLLNNYLAITTNLILQLLSSLYSISSSGQFMSSSRQFMSSSHQFMSSSRQSLSSSCYSISSSHQSIFMLVLLTQNIIYYSATTGVVATTTIFEASTPVVDGKQSIIQIWFQIDIFLQLMNNWVSFGSICATDMGGL